MYKTILLTGIPRSGTTLTCNLLNKHENTLALLEPIQQFPDPINGKSKASIEVAKLAFQYRQNCLLHSKVTSMHKEGHIPTNTLEHNPTKALREKAVSHGIIKLSQEYSREFTLVIKQNAFFTSIIEELTLLLPCYGIIRNPLSVLTSWETVNIPINRGHIPEGEQFDSKLKNKLKSTKDNLDRQIIILNWFFSNFHKHIPTHNLIKYEDIISSNGNILSKISYNGKIKKDKEVLTNMNTNKLYKAVNIKKIYDKLINSEGLFWKYYSKADIDELYQKMQKTYQHP